MGGLKNFSFPLFKGSGEAFQGSLGGKGDTLFQEVSQGFKIRGGWDTADFFQLFWGGGKNSGFSRASGRTTGVKQGGQRENPKRGGGDKGGNNGRKRGWGKKKMGEKKGGGFHQGGVKI